jgi:uncharacterized protein YecT (DUF1311 family)
MNRLFSAAEARVKEVDDKHAAAKTPGTGESWLQLLKDAQEKWISYRKASASFGRF